MKTYIIARDGFVKIGKSKSPIGRVASLQTGHSESLRLLLVLDGDQERNLHRQFAKDRVGGEWFVASPDIRAFVEKHLWSSAPSDPVDALRCATSLTEVRTSADVPHDPSPGIPSPGIPSPGIPSPGIPSPGIPSPGIANEKGPVAIDEILRPKLNLLLLRGGRRKIATKDIWRILDKPFDGTDRITSLWISGAMRRLGFAPTKVYLGRGTEAGYASGHVTRQ